MTNENLKNRVSRLIADLEAHGRLWYYVAYFELGGRWR